jgi:hypothetical protein
LFFPVLSWAEKAALQLQHALPEFTQGLAHHYLLDRFKPQRISELTINHLILKFWLASARPQELISQSTYYAIEAWQKFLEFQKKQNPQLHRLEFEISQVEAELFQVATANTSNHLNTAKPFEVQLKLHWPFVDLELLRAKLEYQRQYESANSASLTDRVSIQIFDLHDIKWVHLMLEYRVKLQTPSQIERPS